MSVVSLWVTMILLTFFEAGTRMKIPSEIKSFYRLPWEASDKASDDCEPVCETLSMFK